MLAQIIGKRLILPESLLVELSGIVGLEDLIFIFSYSGIGYLSSRISQQHALNEDPKKIGQLFRSGLVLSLIYIAFAGLICFSAKEIFKVTQQPLFVIDGASYFHYAFFAYLVDFIYRTEIRVVIGLGASMPAFLGDLIQCVLDLCFTAWFVIRWNRGLDGSALAYLISVAITLAGFSCYLMFSKYRQYHLFHFFEGLLDCGMIIKHGLHNSIASAFEFIVQLILSFECGLSNPASMLGFQVASQFSMVNALITQAIMEVGSVKTAFYFEKNDSNYRRYANMTIFISQVISMLLGGIANASAKKIANIYVTSGDPERIGTIISFLGIQSIIEILNSARNSISSVFGACNQTKFPMIVSLFSILFINTALTLLSFFLFKKSVFVSNTLQITGFFISVITLQIAWIKKKEQTEDHKNRPSLFQGGFSRTLSGNTVDSLQVENDEANYTMF